MVLRFDQLVEFLGEFGLGAAAQRGERKAMSWGAGCGTATGRGVLVGFVGADGESAIPVG